MTRRTTSGTCDWRAQVATTLRSYQVRSLPALPCCRCAQYIVQSLSMLEAQDISMLGACVRFTIACCADRIRPLSRSSPVRCSR